MLSPRSPKILIVEDVPSLAESYAAYLRKECQNIDIAGDGQAALDCLETSPPDLVLLDVNLPDMNGKAQFCLHQIPESFQRLTRPRSSMSLAKITRDMPKIAR